MNEFLMSPLGKFEPEVADIAILSAVKISPVAPISA